MYAGAARRGRGQLERSRPPVIGEEPLAPAEHDRLDHEAVLVDQVGEDEPPRLMKSLSGADSPIWPT